ncbi:MAG: hypothetical protein LBC30_01580 [Puniceicoccales bacterium]|jgi:hypothetical protein|nr:hypothetical protein [Puniceicoccales bacterium]
MEGVRRTKSGQDDGQVVARPEEKDEFPLDISTISVEKVERTVTAGRRAVSIPQAEVYGSALGTRSVIATNVPRNSRVNSPTSWLELTPENAVNLKENEFIQLLSHRGIFDVSKLGYILFFPEGYSIAAQMINLIPGNRLLRLVGEGLESAYYFAHIFFEKKFLGIDNSQVPTMESLHSIIQAKCKSQLQGLSQKSMNDRITDLTQTVRETCADEDKCRKFESNLRNLTDLIFSKLPSPNIGNQILWDNIRRAVEDNVHRFYDTDGEKKLEELKGRFSVLNFTPKPFGTNRLNTTKSRPPARNSGPRSFESNRLNTTKSRPPAQSSNPRSFESRKMDTGRIKENRQFKKGWRKRSWRNQKSRIGPLGIGTARYRR